MYSDIAGTYILVVAQKPTNVSISPVLTPTWPSVRDFFEYTLLKDVGATVKIPDSVVAILQNQSYVELSGCPAQCLFADGLFPSADATAPVVSGIRLDINTCFPPDAESAALDRYTPTAPSFYEYTDGCDAQWSKYQVWRSGLRG